MFRSGATVMLTVVADLACSSPQLDADLDVSELLHKLVDCHQDGLAERWAATLDVEMQVRVT